MNKFNKLRAFLRRRTLPVTACVTFLAAIGLVLHAFWRPVAYAGPDGETYLRLGNAAAAAPSLVECGNFTRSYWSPGWVVTIGAVQRISGPRPISVRMALIAAAIATAWLVWAMAVRLAGGCAAVVAVCLFLFSTLVFRYTSYYQYEIPLALLTALSGYLLFFAPRQFGKAALGVVAAGAVTAFAALYSPRVLALIPPMIVCSGISKGWRRAVVTAAALLVGITAVLLPWTLRNHHCFDQWIVTTTNGGINLYIGNNAYSTGGYYLPAANLRPPYAFHESARWVGEAVGYAVDHPGQTLGRSFIKALKFWNPHYGDQILVLLLFLVGWIRLLRSRRRWDSRLLWVAAVPIVITLVHAVFFVQVRYMIPVLPMVAVIAGAGACGWKPDERTPSDVAVPRAAGG